MNERLASAVRRCGRHLAVALLGLCVAATAAFAQSSKGGDETLSPEVGKILVQVQDLMKENKNQEALAKLDEADQVKDRTPFENFFIARMRGAAAARVGDMATATKAFEFVVDSKRLPPADQLKLLESLGILYFKDGNYAKAISWLSRYVDEGGDDPQFKLLLARARYETDDYATAARELRALVDAQGKAGTVPTREELQLLLNSYSKLKDTEGYGFALEKLLAYYPKKEYWVEGIRRVELKPEFSDTLSLDVFRLVQTTAGLETAAQTMAMAQLAMRSGLPAEAKKILDQGFAAGTLGSGPEADAQRKLRDMVAKQAADDERTWGKDAKSAESAKDGNGLVSTGFAMVFAGRADQGLALMEQGLQKGGLKRPDEAKLHLGVAYVVAGQKAKADEAFKSVQGTDGTADLARLWRIYLQKPTS